MQPTVVPDLAEFEVSAERGFLPAADPLDRLPKSFDAWEEIAGQLPKLLIADQVRRAVDSLPLLDPSSLKAGAEIERAMMLLSYLGHAYVWGSRTPGRRIPRSLAVPWHAVAVQLGRPPVLSYASYALHNWRHMDPGGAIALGNISLLQNFLGGMDEEWFILVHVEIEALAAAALRAIPELQQGVSAGARESALQALQAIAVALHKMHATLARMPERCDPYIYFNRVRPYIHGWKDQPSLPDGLVYEGVDAYGERPQQFRGETGAQSSIIPSLDAALGIAHGEDPLRAYLNEMRDYMPARHRAFIAHVERGPATRAFVEAHRTSPLREAYNECVHAIQEFRGLHLEYAGSYVHRQSQRSDANPSAVGTGGTPFMAYLKKHRDETQAHLIA